MSRYIDKDKLIKALANKCKETDRIDYDYGTGVGIAKELVEHFDTADVVEVVRCKDCKWYRGVNDKYFPRTCEVWDEMFHHFEGWEQIDENWYCSQGERSDK